MPVGKHAGQRIRENLKTARQRAAAIQLDLQKAGLNIEFKSGNESLDYNLDRASHASAALDLTAPGADSTLKRVFSDAGLDPENPWHWRVLLEIFVDAYYPPLNANQHWSSSLLTALLVEEYKLKIEYPKDAKKRTRILKKWISEQYQNGKRGKILSDGTLRKLLRAAKDPRKNEMLASVLPEAVESFSSLLSKIPSPSTIKEVEASRDLFIQRSAEAMAVTQYVGLTKRLRRLMVRP